MNPYEVMVMFGPEVDEGRQDEIVAGMRQIAEAAGGTFHADDVWGRRKLAYEIRKETEAVYHVVTFDTTPEALDEIGRRLKINDDVLRHMAVRRLPSSNAAESAPVS